MSFLNTIISGVFNAIFPISCISCGKSGADLCMACLENTPSAERESKEWIYPLYDYRHPPIKKALSMFKYKNRKRLAKLFAGSLYYKIIEELSELSVMENFKNPILIPIPLSKRRRRERGYNQAELICQELMKIDEEKTFCFEKNVLVKSKETEHQARIKDRSQRLKNLSGSFAVKNSDLIKARNIILVDDIVTTGATLNEARKILKKAGARKIIAFTVAH